MATLGAITLIAATASGLARKAPFTPSRARRQTPRHFRMQRGGDDDELYRSLRSRIANIENDELRAELEDDPWARAREAMPVSGEFLEAMNALKEQRARQRRVQRQLAVLGVMIALLGACGWHWLGRVNMG